MADEMGQVGPDKRTTGSAAQSSLTSVVKGSGTILAGLMIGKVLGTLNQVLFARILGPEQYGLFNLGLSITTILVIISMFGLQDGITRFVSMALKEKDYGKLISVVSFGILFGLISSVLFGLLLIVAAPWFSANVLGKPDLQRVLRLFALSIPFTALMYIFVSILRGMKESRLPVLIQEVVARLSRTVVFLILLLVGFRLTGALTAWTISSACAALFALVVTVRKAIVPFKGRGDRIPVAREILTYSWPLTLSSFILLAMTQSSQLILGAFAAAEDVGYYFSAMSIAQLLNFILYSFGFVFLPAVSALFLEKDFEAIGRLYASVTKWIFMISFPVFLVFISFPDTILTILYGEEYVSGAVVLVFLSIGILVTGSTGLKGLLLNGIGKTRLTLAADLTGSLVNVALNIVLIKLYGILGAAIATAFSLSLRNILALVFVKREIKMKIYDASFLKIALVDTLIMAVAYFVARQAGLYWQPLIIIPFVLLCYAAIVKLDLIDDYDREIVGKIGDRFPMGRKILGLIGLR